MPARQVRRLWYIFDVNISKTEYLLWRECKKNAWLKLHKPKIFYSFPLSEFEKSIIETGNEVEIVARRLFPTGVLIEGRDEQAQKLTQKYIAEKERTLFQPVFLKDGFLAALDILQYDKETGKYSIFEIKASNDVDEKTHLYDLSFQVALLKKCGIKIDVANIIHLNSKYERHGELDIEKLFTISNQTKEIEELLPKVEFEMNVAKEYLSQEKEPPGYCDCVYKGRSAHCATFTYSNPTVPEYGIHDIARIGMSKKKLQEFADRGIFKLEDLPDNIELSEIQQNQVRAYVENIEIKNKVEISKELKNLVFPLYFLDYETYPSAIPRFDDFSPYQQIPFQYSLHIVEKAGVEPVHKEFLHTGSDNPSEHFVKSLQNHIGPTGNVIVWNKKFECKINNELAKRIPEAKSFLEALNARVYDLMDIFSKQFYVHKDFKGSTSIKYVLPVLAPELSYKKLEIQEGGTASQKWNELTTTHITKEERNEIAENLKRYCELDTFAMYAIWKHLDGIL